MKKCKIALTMGDPSGVGAEIVCKVLHDKMFISEYDISVFGYKEILEYTYERIYSSKLEGVNIIEPAEPMSIYQIGQISAESGAASISFVRDAVISTLNCVTDAVVTAPINKKSIQLAGFKFPGHTEYLAYLTKCNNVSMMLMGDNIKVVLATTHTPISRVASLLSEEKILNAIKNAHSAGVFFGKRSPFIAVTGLNPHAGDHGAIGDEEQNIIIPAIKAAQKMNINVDGPYPADTLFYKMQNKFCDFAVVMYHDQGLIPVKMESFGQAVNVSLNLPIIRTSVDHGTAFDIAEKYIASEKSLKRAIETADIMVKNSEYFRNI